MSKCNLPKYVHWVGQYEPLALFFVDQSSPIFWPNLEGVVVDQIFQMFNMSIRSGDIRDQSRKLSEIAPKFGRFLALPIFFLGGGFQKLYANYHPCLAPRRLEKFREDTLTSPEVIEAHTLNFQTHFKFSRLNFFGRNPRPNCSVRKVAFVNLQRVEKFQGAAPPNGRNVVFRKMSTWVGQYEPIEFFVCGPEFTKVFFAQRGRGCG